MSQPTEAELQAILDRALGAPRLTGVSVAWRNSQRLTDMRCVVFSGPGGHSRCPREATWKAWFGCEHEHVAPSDICGFHMAQIQRYKGGFKCSLCENATGELVLARFIRAEPLEDELPDGLVG